MATYYREERLPDGRKVLVEERGGCLSMLGGLFLLFLLWAIFSNDDKTAGSASPSDAQRQQWSAEGNAMHQANQLIYKRSNGSFQVRQLGVTSHQKDDGTYDVRLTLGLKSLKDGGFINLTKKEPDQVDFYFSASARRPCYVTKTGTVTPTPHPAPDEPVPHKLRKGELFVIYSYTTTAKPD